DRRDPCQHGAFERVREAHADLEVAGVRGIVTDQNEIVRRAFGRTRLDNVGDRCRDVAGAARRPVGLDQRRIGTTDYQCIPPSVAWAICTASSIAHSSCVLMVCPSRLASTDCSSAVRATEPPVSGTRLIHTKTFAMAATPYSVVPLTRGFWHADTRVLAR